MISIVAAIDDKRGIGKNNDLLFKIPGDMKHFKDLTMGRPVIMGRKTFESIGRILPYRTNIIVSRDPNYKVEEALVVSSLEDALEKAKMCAGSHEGTCIIGGGQIFKEAIEKDLVDVLHLTIVKGDYGADTFFPEYETKFPKIASEESHEEGGYSYAFQTRTHG